MTALVVITLKNNGLSTIDLNMPFMCLLSLGHLYQNTTNDFLNKHTFSKLLS